MTTRDAIFMTVLLSFTVTMHACITSMSIDEIKNAIISHEKNCHGVER